MTEAAKRTPGTWTAYESAGFKGEWGVQTDDPAMVEAGDEIIVYPSLSEEYARRIAAAPDMLAVLRDFVSETRAYSSPECDECEIVGPLLRAADAAIAKAEGRPS
ncbi:hypothetical protein [Allomesorhizobium alhagi]|uniref:Uncharacterized protein n=1 Tax=Mesorhizobium alhagi CCNWXJ12-2 TaxID=1107882 RepID=H0HQZ0_9HYPH|nr:hypothetical protein [Mesorhizobium alhagi]EHK56852.1 hypothetical protein MAXJ12_12862 [Mesorhizobium alhagi CCNWXJ12-2]